MATMQFDLVSPERRLASMDVTEVQIPGADGDLTAMPDHAPMITTLRPGILRAHGTDGVKAYFVTGGFADVAGPSATILAERAMPVDEVTPEVMDELVADATKKRDDAPEGAGDAAAKFLADLVAAGEEIKLG
ncbi:F0F1 ATP synthase subunit epsilon [Gymnodinialimonas sp. 2305UL16-5]|uniref:F0F1 ATP synthase subunit epsilon n=1 Tax=Gymnodinialimonas mytili TaxID=3126503 RepID=UPI0030B5B495